MNRQNEFRPGNTISLADLWPRIRRFPLLFLTMHDTEPMFRRAMELGALGFILKDGALIEIVQGIDSAMRGDVYCSAPLAGFLQPRSHLSDDYSNPVSGLAQLTPAELRLLLLIVVNRTAEEIAHALCLSPRTVEGHRANMSRKLGLAGTHSLLRFALMNRSRLPVSPQPIQHNGHGKA